MVLMMGVAVLPNGQHRMLFVVEGAPPTKSMITLVVNQ